MHKSRDLKNWMKIKNCGSDMPSGTAHPIWNPVLMDEEMSECSRLMVLRAEVLGPYFVVALHLLAGQVHLAT